MRTVVAVLSAVSSVVLIQGASASGNSGGSPQGRLADVQQVSREFGRAISPSGWKIFSVVRGTSEEMAESASQVCTGTLSGEVSLVDSLDAAARVREFARANPLVSIGDGEINERLGQLERLGAQFAFLPTLAPGDTGTSFPTLAVMMPREGWVVCLPLSNLFSPSETGTPVLGTHRTSETNVEVFAERSVVGPEANVIMAYEHVIHDTSSDRPNTVIDLYETRIELQRSTSNSEDNRGFLPMVQVEFVYRGRVTERDVGRLTIATRQRSWRGDFRRRVPDGIEGIASLYPIGWGKDLTLNLDSRGTKALLNFGVDAFGLRILNREGHRDSSVRFAPLRAEVELGAELPLNRNYTLAFTFLGASSRLLDSYPQYEVFHEISLRFQERFRIWARFANEFHYGEGSSSLISLGIGYRF